MADEIDGKLTRFIERANGAARISLAVFAVLLVSWQSQLSPNRAVLRSASLAANSARQRRESISGAAEQYAGAIADFEREKQRVVATSSGERAEARLRDIDDALRGLRNRHARSLRALENASNAFQAHRRLAQDVAFSVFGFSFGISGEFAPVVWLALALVALVNLAASRRVFLSDVAAAMSEKSGRLDPSIVSMTPLWVRPIPGIHFDGGTMRIRLGRWRPWRDPLGLATVAAAVVCVGLAPLVGGIGLALHRTMEHDRAVRANMWFGSGDFVEFTVLMLLASVLLAVLSWLVPVRLRVDRAGSSVGYRRRQVLSMAVMLISGGAVIAAARERLLPTLRNPRFRRRRSVRPALPSGLYEDQVTGTIHNISIEGASRSLVGMNADNLRRLGVVTSAQYERLDRRARTAWLRAHTKQCLRENLPEEAATMLIRAIHDDLSALARSRRMPNVQLYDLLAGVAARWSNAAYLDEASRLLLVASPRLGQSTFLQRARDTFDAEGDDLGHASRRFGLHRFEGIVSRYGNAKTRRTDAKAVLELIESRRIASNDRSRWELHRARRISAWSNDWLSSSNRHRRVVRQRGLGRRKRGSF